LECGFLSFFAVYFHRPFSWSYSTPFAAMVDSPVDAMASKITGHRFERLCPDINYIWRNPFRRSIVSVAEPS
jgi:hypothetical protein